MLRTLTRQLIHDLKASWRKSAVLGVLLMVGLCFWLPMLYRTVFSESGSPAAAAPPPPAAPLPVVGAPVQAPAARLKESAASAPSAISWESAEDALQTDPLLGSAAVSSIERDPFQTDPDQFSPPILFAESEDTDSPPDAGSSAPEGLVLKSTIVGSNRRAAFINTKLYFEGADVRVADATYRLSAVFSRKVVLTRDNREFELKLAERSPTGRIELERPDGAEK